MKEAAAPEPESTAVPEPEGSTPEPEGSTPEPEGSSEPTSEPQAEITTTPKTIKPKGIQKLQELQRSFV